MRPASSRQVPLWMTALCLLAVLCNLEGLASAQSPAGSKRKLSQHSLLNQQPAAAARRAANAQPPLTADSWTGTAGDNNWNTAANWSAGVPTSSLAVTIGTSSANVNVSGTTGMFGTLALSGSGDSLAIANNSIMDAFGNITNNGSLNLNSTGNFTELVLEGNVVLSGTGTLTLSNNVNNFIFGAVATDQLTNQQTIQGAGQIGDGKMALVNSGTINANQSAGMTIDANDGFTNTGTTEATAGSKLTLQSTGVNNVGGTISANASTLNVSSSVISGGSVTLTGASTLQLNTGTIGGGTITNSATGTIEVMSGTNAMGGTINNSAGGIFKIDNNAVLDLQGGTYSQLGAVQLNSSGNFTELVLAGNVTLSGGSVTLSNNANNFIFGTITANTLTNKETISGAGNIGNGKMTLVNSGTINSNQSAGMTIAANGGVTNTGTLEATAGATLALSSTGTINNTGGTILANTGTLQLTNSTISGGAVTLTGASSMVMSNGTIHGGSTLTNSATGTIEVASGTNTLGGTINNSTGGTFKIDNNAVLNLEGGTYSQLGTVQLNSAGNFTELVLQDNVTLSGGAVTMSNNVNNFIFGQVSTDTLTNKETISGAGQIGDARMTLINSGTGVINANQSAGITIDANGGVTNTGTLEATSGATLALASTTVANTGGTISANTGTLQVTNSTVNGGTITLTGASALQLNNGTVHGGSTLTNSATGTIEIVAGTNTLGGTINNSTGGTFKIDNNAILQLEGGTYSQMGTVQLNSSGNFTELVLEGNVTLSGGALTMSNNVNNFIFGQVGGNTLTNQETISGAGQIGDGKMTLVNSGTINSNQSSGITINANGGVTNTGTLEATSGATLALASTTVANTGGTISANTGTVQVTSSTVNGGTITLTGASALQLSNGTVHGGSTITNSSTGTIEVTAGTSTLGGTINNSAGGVLKVDNNTILQLEGGTYAQLGAVQLNSSGNFTELVLGGNVTLSGGTLTLSNNVNNFIFGATSTDTLTNQETIQGGGQIGNGKLTLVNSGTINSNQSSGMTINANGGVTNTGTLEATSGAVLALASSTVNNAGGTIAANTGTIQVTSSTVNGGAITLTGASALQLSNGTVHGGSTITNSSSGTIEVTGGTSVLGGTINNSAGGIIKVDNNTILQLEGGTYSQIGAMQINSSGNFTELVIEGNTTLGGGTVTMSGNANNFILGAASFDVLTNQATIQGAGNIGNGTMGLVNTGTILANASGNLVINVSNQNFNNTGGTVEASGATLTIQGSGVTFLTNDNQSTNTLTGGTYIANGSNIQWSAGLGGITTLAANVTEEGGGELFNTCSGCTTNMLAGLTSITSAGSLTIGGLAFTDAGAFSNAGSLTLLPGESFTVGSLSQISGGSLTAGTYVLDANLNLSGTAQTITTNAATLTLAGGTIENTSNSTNALAGLATNSGKLTIGGAGNNVSTTAASFSNTGTLSINGNDSFTAAKLTQISGTTLSGGTFVLGGNLDLTTAGISVTTNSSTLTLQGGTINSNGVNALAALAKNTKSLTIAGSGNNVSTTAASFSNSSTVNVQTGASFTLTGTGHNYTQTAGTTTVDGTLTATGISATGGSIFGAGALNGNTSVGNATGTAVTINVGDSGKAGLLAITGTYTQLATGTMTGLINGTTAGTGFSQLNVTGTAALAGSINFTVSSGFQSSLTLGETFTVLNAASITGTFSNSTIAINSSFHFTVTYTSTGVVLTVASGPVSGPSSSPARPVAQAAMVTTTAAANRSKSPIATGGLSQRTSVIGTSKIAKPIFTSGLGRLGSRSNAILARGTELSGRRSWEHLPVTPMMAKPVAVSRVVTAVNSAASHNNVAPSNGWVGQNRIVSPSKVGWIGNSSNSRVPVKIMSPALHRMTR